MVNKVLLIGNLGQDPEVRRLENGTMVARITVATNESYRDKNNEWQTITEWHNVILWRYLAERAENQLKKGSQVYIEGKLTHRKYQTQEGQDRYVTEVVANTFRILGPKLDGAGNSSRPAFPTEAPAAMNTNTTATTTTTAAPAADDQEDDLPF